MEKRVISLDERDFMQLKMIVLDEDRNEALAFLKEILKRIESAEKHECRPPFETGHM